MSTPRTLVTAIALIAIVMWGASAAQTPVVRTADPIARGLKESDFPRLVKVTNTVYTWEDFHPSPERFTTNSLIVLSPTAVLVADGQANAAATKAMVDAIAKLTPAPIKYIVVASDHGDHTGGNASFPAGAKFFIHPTSKDILDKAAAARPTAWKLPADTEVVADTKKLTMDGEDIEILFLGRAHTGGDLNVYLPQQKILFMSEIFLNRVFPAMRSAYPSEWLTVIDKALAMRADIYIPGHGFTETGPVSREELVEYRKAVAAVIAEGTRLFKAGVPVEEAVKQANWGEYAKWRIASSQGPIAMRKVYEELGKK
jgi:cyclase